VKIKFFFFAAFLALALCLTMAAVAGSNNNKDAAATAPGAAAPTHAPAQDDPLRLEGEKRYHANCGRCHNAPPRFAPRMMATIVRHMRVRATITDQDMHLILHYMTQ
jgi:cytochrome c5